MKNLFPFLYAHLWTFGAIVLIGAHHAGRLYEGETVTLMASWFIVGLFSIAMTAKKV